MTDTTTTTIAPPANAAEARALLDTRIADKDWGAKLLAGNSDVGREFRELSEKAGGVDPIDAAIAGIVPASENGLRDSDAVMRANVATTLRELGIRDAVIRDHMTDRKYTAEEVAAVTQLKAERMSDREWTKKYLAGDAKAVKDMTLIHIILDAGVEGKEAQGF